jgi:HEAT repeat protein
MWKRRRILTFAVIIAVLAGLAWLVLSAPPSEPVYQGRTLNSWLREAMDTAGDTVNPDVPKAEDAIKKIGTNALPSLIRMLRAKDSPVKLALMRLAGKQKIIQFQFETASDLHVRAAYGCIILGPEASASIPALIELLQEGEPSSIAGDALVNMGPEGVRALAGALTNTDSHVRYFATAALAGVSIRRQTTDSTAQQIATHDEEVKIAVPALIKLLKNKSDTVRDKAAESLGAIGRQPDTVIPALIAMLRDEGSSWDGVPFAIAATSALGSFGRQAEAAVPDLVLALKNPSPGLRDAAAKALKQIDPEAAAKAGVK